MNDRQKKINALRRHFIFRIAESRGEDDFTSFDKEVLNALDKLRDAYRNVAVSPECASLGFVLKSGKDASSGSFQEVPGCKTIPCFGGKTPYQEEPETICDALPGVCKCSPVQMVKDMLADKQERETNDDAD